MLLLLSPEMRDVTEPFKLEKPVSEALVDKPVVKILSEVALL